MAPPGAVDALDDDEEPSKLLFAFPPGLFRPGIEMLNV